MPNRRAMSYDSSLVSACNPRFFKTTAAGKSLESRCNTIGFPSCRNPRQKPPPQSAPPQKGRRCAFIIECPIQGHDKGQRFPLHASLLCSFGLSWTAVHQRCVLQNYRSWHLRAANINLEPAKLLPCVLQVPSDIRIRGVGSRVQTFCCPDAHYASQCSQAYPSRPIPMTVEPCSSNKSESVGKACSPVRERSCEHSPAGA